MQAAAIIMIETPDRSNAKSLEIKPMKYRSLPWLVACCTLLSLAPVLAEPMNVPPEGFVALFNGKDLAGWRGASTENPNNRLKLDPEARAAKDQASVEDIHKHWTVE